MFHWQDNWFFQRLPDDGVRIEKREDAPFGQGGELVAMAEIPPDAWASIVAHVSQFGDDKGHWDLARTFHGVFERKPGED